MTHEDQVFVTNVVVMDLRPKMVAMSVISQPASVTMELSTIAKIHKYKRIHERHHFILIAMEVHNAPKRDIYCFIKKYARLFHNRWSRGCLSLYLCIQIFKQCVSIALQHASIFAIEKTIVLAGDACSRPPITIKSHDLHACDIRSAMGQIASYHERD
jgi:hypothetical protein